MQRSRWIASVFFLDGKIKEEKMNEDGVTRLASKFSVQETVARASRRLKRPLPPSAKPRPKHEQENITSSLHFCLAPSTVRQPVEPFCWTLFGQREQTLAEHHRGQLKSRSPTDHGSPCLLKPTVMRRRPTGYDDLADRDVVPAPVLGYDSCTTFRLEALT